MTFWPDAQEDPARRGLELLADALERFLSRNRFSFSQIHGGGWVYSDAPREFFVDYPSFAHELVDAFASRNRARTDVSDFRHWRCHVLELPAIAAPRKAACPRSYQTIVLALIARSTLSLVPDGRRSIR